MFTRRYSMNVMTINVRSTFLLALLSIMPLALKAEEAPIMTLDALADVYYEAESGEPVVADEIKSLNGKTVRIAGYMVPFNDLENLKEFMLMPSSNGCNFCESPMKEEIVYVRQPGKKKYEYISEPLVMTGKLWVKGAGTDAPNSTYAQFLYGLQDAKLEKLKPEDQALLQVVTPRTIIKQVCSLLRVRLLKQVKFEPMTKEDFFLKRSEMLLKYFNGVKGLNNIKLLLESFNMPDAENILPVTNQYLADWTAAFSDSTGEVIYYLEDLDLSVQENQRQIAIACYDLLFHQEVNMGEQIHKGNPSYDEILARLSLILGLRQSFAQFYGSIGLIDLLPMETFAVQFRNRKPLPAPYSDIVEQLLLKSEPFIAEVYKAEQFQPYTKAITAPPLSMAQILTPSLYTDEKRAYKAPQTEGYDNRLGAYLISKVTGINIDELDLIADGIRFQGKGTDLQYIWELQFSSEKKASEIVKRLVPNERIVASSNGKTITIHSKL